MLHIIAFVNSNFHLIIILKWHCISMLRIFGFGIMAKGLEVNLSIWKDMRCIHNIVNIFKLFHEFVMIFQPNSGSRPNHKALYLIFTLLIMQNEMLISWKLSLIILINVSTYLSKLQVFPFKKSTSPHNLI